jgi:hypothetical protein
MINADNNAKLRNWLRGGFKSRRKDNFTDILQDSGNNKNPTPSQLPEGQVFSSDGDTITLGNNDYKTK